MSWEFSGYHEVFDSSSSSSSGSSDSSSSSDISGRGLPKLSLDDVKKLARKEGCELISISKKSRVVSFRKDYGGNSVRINVYWTTGTVGTCLDHPRQGKTQLFRRNTDMKTLREIFRNPRLHTGAGYQTVKAAKRAAAKRKAEEEAEAERKRRKKRKEAKRKAEEEAEAERKKRKKRKEEKLKLERFERGNKIDFLLYDSDFVSEQFDKDVVSMSCGGEATIFLYESGAWAFSSEIPKLLHNKLNGRQRTLPSPVYVSIGSQDRYYIQFKDGQSEWVGCNDMGKELKETKDRVKTVAFGEDWDSFCVVYTSGACVYKNVPHDLDKLLRQRDKADLTCVSLGPDGEYFVSAQNGKAWWGGMNAENIAQMKPYKDRIVFMDFGDNDSFFVRYS